MSNSERSTDGTTNRHQRRATAAHTRHQRERPAPLHNAFAYSVADTCRMTGLGRTTVYGLCRDGRLTFVKVNDRRLILGDSARALLNIAA
jgi:hypothetical protein